MPNDGERAAGGAALALHHADLGSGAPVVLVHGWSASSAVFADEVARLARARRVIAPDLRGHGRSATAPFSLEDLAADVAALFDALALERAVLAGWSLGAQVALAALPLVRRRLAGLVLVAATPRFTSGEGWPHGLSPRSIEALAQRVRRDPARALAGFREAMFAEGELAHEGRRRALEALGSTSPDPGALQAGLDVLVSADLRAALPSIDVPVILLHGERDAICPVGAARAMAEAVPRARLELVPGAGHAPFLSRPGLLARAVSSFSSETP